MGWCHWCRRIALGFCAAGMLGGPGLAQKGDIEFGRYLASDCLSCHRSVAAGGAIPSIFGMEVNRFAVLMRAYRDKGLPNPVMQSIASRLKDDEIDALAHFFAVTKKP